MIVLVSVWYFLGVIGATPVTISDLINGRDFTVNDLIIRLLTSILGPVTFFLRLTAYLSNRK